MGTGGKIAIGCGVVALLGVIVFVVAIGGAAYWAKGKVQTMAGEQEKIAELQKKANRNDFTRPADGVIAEDRLVKFLDVRKRVYSVYQKYEKDIEARGKKQKADFGDLSQAFTMINEIRLAQAGALADIGMSEDEYRFLVEQIYKTLWASEVSKSTGGKTVSEAAGRAYEKAAEEMQKAANQVAEARKTHGDEATEQSKEAVESGAEELRKQASEVRKRAQDLDVPPANIALFQKYEADIKKYAMNGLEWIGL